MPSFVILTHAHLDHCGLLPVLVRRGYQGLVYATAASADLMSMMLRDSTHIRFDVRQTARMPVR